MTAIMYLYLGSIILTSLSSETGLRKKNIACFKTFTYHNWSFHVDLINHKKLNAIILAVSSIAQ